MDREKTLKAIKVMQASIEGKELEWAGRLKNDWTPDKFPTWNWTDFKWRVKPTKPRIGKLVSPYQDYIWEGIELTDAVKEALEKAGIKL